MKGVWKSWLIATGIMGAITFAAIPILYRDLYVKEVLEGWALSLFGGILGTWMRRRAMRGESAEFLGWGVLGSVLRLLITVTIVGVYHFVDAGYLPAFAVTVVIGYLSFTAAEVGALYRQAVGGMGQHE